MGLLDLLKNELDDLSYIEEMEHIKGPWNQYDFYLAAGIYGWDYMIASAEYLIDADLSNIGTISLSIDNSDTELIDRYNPETKSLGSISELKEEGRALGIGGISHIFEAPVKVVWFNQTRVLRIFSPVDNEDKFLRYAETLIRRTFNTKDQMKKAKPVK